MADIERLTSDKADLLNRLHCFEEDLKTANECEITVYSNNYCGLLKFRFSIDTKRESYFRYDDVQEVS